MILPTSTAGFIALLGAAARIATAESVPAPPATEPIALTELPLPPAAPSSDAGACTAAVNPSGTGCIENAVTAFQSGDFLPDGKHVIAKVVFTGAPASPDPASIYSGVQAIIVKTDNTTFSNGDAWKCVSCGVPDGNKIGIDSSSFDYPQAFKDGTRLLLGTNILDCQGTQLTSDECLPENTFIYPLRWQTSADGSGAGGSMRELRIHPDQEHLMFNSYTVFGSSIGQYGYFGRLAFNPAPTVGTPLAPRYDVVNVTRLYNPEMPVPYTTTEDGEISYNPDARVVGEARGFNGDGSEVTYVGYSTESCNIDVFAAHLTTGVVRRLTSHPEYCDPLAFSPDNKWIAIMDTRGSGRNMFLAGMRGLPPMVDLVVNTLAASVRNNGPRRFFQPYLLDFYGDRGDYYGQKINGDNNGVPGSGDINDPEWNGMADPRWSPDSTQLVFWQAQTVSPSCGGDNPLPCYNSTEPGGLTYRMYVATFTSRSPSTPAAVEEHSDTIPWGVPYTAGQQAPQLPEPAAGLYTLTGKASGSAEVNITWLTAPQVGVVSVVYNNFSDDGLSFFSGTESAMSTAQSLLVSTYDWYSDITQTGAVNGSKKTSPDGYHATINVNENILESTGSLVTTLDGVEWRNPEPET